MPKPRDVGFTLRAPRVTSRRGRHGHVFSRRGCGERPPSARTRAQRNALIRLGSSDLFDVTSGVSDAHVSRDGACV